MKTVLLGYMASGKSTIGRTLSKKLYVNFIDLDTYISTQENKNISQIFKEDGEIYFRKIEHKYLKEILNSDENCVLSLGGGTPCYTNNMQLIKESDTKSIYIQASIQTLAERLINKKHTRPLVADLADTAITEFVAKHLFERRFFYEQAQFTIATDHKKVEEIAAEIRILLY
ncbi:MAG: shikimate kinase [Polaribacter sp.]